MFYKPVNICYLLEMFEAVLSCDYWKAKFSQEDINRIDTSHGPPGKLLQIRMSGVRCLQMHP